nr:hypothetical protein [Tanacetum cinerariifolium]
ELAEQRRRRMRRRSGSEPGLERCGDQHHHSRPRRRRLGAGAVAQAAGTGPGNACPDTDRLFEHRHRCRGDQARRLQLPVQTGRRRRRTGSAAVRTRRSGHPGAGKPDVG